LRRLTTVALLVIVAIAPACRSKKRPRAKAVEDEGQVASVVNVADSRTSVQLIRGFHAVETSWRWTEKAFTVTLHPPTGTSETGARLELKFAIPDVIFKRLGPMTVSAKVHGIDLPPETYTAAGDATYTRDVPASALKSDVVGFDFVVDKASTPNDQDNRELALVVTSIGLIAK
jgi:hypothetical protein